MKHIIFIGLLLGSCISAYSQITMKGNFGNTLARFAELEVLDTSAMECLYRHTVTDPEISETRVWYDMLQVGTDYSKYWEYSHYRIITLRMIPISIWIGCM